MIDSFFTTEDGDWFQPTCHTRGPWDVDACHAGPPTGLLARALETELPAQRLSRLTVNLLRPIPFSGFRIESRTVRSGRTVSYSEASLMDKAGKVYATAAGLHLSAIELGELPTHKVNFGTPDSATSGPFPLRRTLHGEPAFNGDGVQMRYPSGENPEPGPTVAWMKTVPLLPSEQSSPFQSICPMADCGNAMGRNAEPSDVQFMNADLTIVLHRDPVGEWLGSESVGYWEPSGIGLADARLFDQKGVVGRAMQTLLLRRG